MAVFIILKVICYTVNMLLSLISCLLCKVTDSIVVITIKALKFPGVAVQFTFEQVGGLARCCLERVMMLFLKNIMMATKKLVDLLVILVVEVITRLLAPAMGKVGDELLKKMKLWLKEVMVGLLNIILKNTRAAIDLFLNHVIDILSRSATSMTVVAVELVKKIKSGCHELMTLVVYCLEIVLDVIEKVVLSYDLVLEVIPRLLVAVGKSIDQMTMAFHELMQQMHRVAEIVRRFIETLSPVIKEMIKKIVSLLYDRVVDFLVEHVKQLVFGSILGSVGAVVLSDYHQLIEQIFVSVVRSMVGKFMAMVMYLFSRRIESIQT